LFLERRLRRGAAHPSGRGPGYCARSCRVLRRPSLAAYSA
jgi:hypothetical protein